MKSKFALKSKNLYLLKIVVVFLLSIFTFKVSAQSNCVNLIDYLHPHYIEMKALTWLENKNILLNFKRGVYGEIATDTHRRKLALEKDLSIKSIALDNRFMARLETISGYPEPVRNQLRLMYVPFWSLNASSFVLNFDSVRYQNYIGENRPDQVLKTRVMRFTATVDTDKGPKLLVANLHQDVLFGQPQWRHGNVRLSLRDLL